MRDRTLVSIMCFLALGGAAPSSPETRRPEGTIQLVGPHADRARGCDRFNNL